ncbi:MAG: hypothetical protein ABWX84_07055 [Nocardioides sp.]
MLPLDVPGANTAFAAATARAEASAWRGAVGLPAGVSVRTAAEAGADVPGAGDDDVVLSAADASGVHVVYAVRSLADLEAAGGVTPLLVALDTWADHSPDQLSVVAGRPAADPGAVLRLLALGGPNAAPTPAPTSDAATTLVRLMRESLGDFGPEQAVTAARGCADAGAYLDWATGGGSGAPAGGDDAPDGAVDLVAELRRLRVTLIGDDSALTPPSTVTTPGLLPVELAAGAAIAVVQGVFDVDPVTAGEVEPVDRVPARALATRLLRPRGAR